VAYQYSQICVTVLEYQVLRNNVGMSHALLGRHLRFVQLQRSTFLPCDTENIIHSQFLDGRHHSGLTVTLSVDRVGHNTEVYTALKLLAVFRRC